MTTTTIAVSETPYGKFLVQSYDVIGNNVYPIMDDYETDDREHAFDVANCRAEELGESVIDETE